MSKGDQSGAWYVRSAGHTDAHYGALAQYGTRIIAEDGQSLALRGSGYSGNYGVALPGATEWFVGGPVGGGVDQCGDCPDGGLVGLSTAVIGLEAVPDSRRACSPTAR